VSFFDHSPRNYSAYGDDRQQISRVRQVAEELFAPKRRVTEQPATESPSSTAPLGRKPRVLRVEAPAIPPEKVEVSVKPEPQRTHDIPKPHFARIRTWLKYGMTLSQVAELYDVPVGQVERILRKA
jgi:hypothetical protein